MGIRRTAAVLGIAGVVAAMVVAGTAFAQTPTPNQQTGTNYQTFFLDRLASLLGTTTDKLNSAITQARNDTVDLEVKDGRITQQQADQIKARQGNGGFGLDGLGGGHMGGPGGPGFMRNGQALDAVAQVLGMTPQDLSSQLQSGKTLADLAKGKEQAVKDAIVNAEKPRLDQAVQDGRITQDQENQMLDQIRNSDLSQFPGLGMRGGPRGISGQDHQPGLTPSSGTSTTSTQTS